MMLMSILMVIARYYAFWNDHRHEGGWNNKVNAPRLCCCCCGAAANHGVSSKVL